MASKKSIKSTKSSEPKSMEALLAKYGGVKIYSRGDRVKGKVIDKRPKALIVDIGGKSEGMVAESAYEEAKDFIETLEIGDEIEARVIVSETPDGFTILSLRNAASTAAWDALSKAKKDEKEVSVVGKNVTQAGIIVDVHGLTGFIPNSQLGREASKLKDSLIDSSFKAIIIDLDKSQNRIVLSEKMVSEEETLKLIKQAIKNVKEDEVFEGKVTTVADFGVFVEIKVTVGKEEIPVEGLVHISEISWRKVGSASDAFQVGDRVKVKIIGKDKGKLAFSVKQAQKDPWDDVEKKYTPDTRVKGKVVKISDFGVFVEIEPGLEGLIHITKIPPNKKLKVEDEVNAYIEEVDKKERRLSLGLVLTAKPVGYK